VAGGVFGYRARKDLVFAHGPLFDAVTGSPKRLADLDRAAGRRRSGDGTRPYAKYRPGMAGASAPRHRRFLAARSGTEDGNDSPQAGWSGSGSHPLAAVPSCEVADPVRELPTTGPVYPGAAGWWTPPEGFQLRL